LTLDFISNQFSFSSDIIVSPIFLIQARFCIELTLSPNHHAKKESTTMDTRLVSITLIALALIGCGGSGGSGGTSSVPLTKAVLYSRTGLDFVYPKGGGLWAMVGYSMDSSNVSRAILWQSSESEPVNLHPSGYSNSMAYGLDGNTTVGEVLDASGWKAALWDGSTNTPTILHPALEYSSTHAHAVKGTRIVGYGFSNTMGRALVWNGANTSPLSLHRDDLYSETFASETDGVNVVGFGITGGTWARNHALVWKGAGLTLTNLHPTTALFSSTFANAVSGTIITGYGQLGTDFHALAWRGTAGSMVDLHPTSGYVDSVALGVQGSAIVGYGRTPGGVERALMWNGLNNSPTDLHTVLATQSVPFVSSQAMEILENGDVVGSATAADGNTYAVRWTR
jgi:hypothetical protein